MNIFKLLLTLCFSIILVGCPLSQTILLYNNTKSDSVIHLEDRQLIWKSGGKIQISDKNGDILWNDLEWRGDPSIKYTPLLTFTYGTNRNTYRLVFPGLAETYINSSPGNIEYHLQLEESGLLYVVPTNQALPIKEKSVMIQAEIFHE